jgi:hypothetical protein
MTSSPPTITGFNNNVRYRGMRFHIQTEDSGITRPHITTHLFADGGYVIKSLRTDYREYVGHPERATLVHRMMRDQHRAVALELRDGKLDATIARIAPSPLEASPLEGGAGAAQGLSESTGGPSASGTRPLVTAADVAALVPPTQPPAEAEEALSSEARSSEARSSEARSSEARSSEAGAAVPGSIPASASAEEQPPSSCKPPSAGSGRPAASRGAASHRPPSSRKPTNLARAAARHTKPGVDKAASSKNGSESCRPSSSRGGATQRPASGAKPSVVARPPSTRTPSSVLPPSNRGADGAGAKRSIAPLTSKPPSSRAARRAGRPSVGVAQPGGPSLFGPMPQESLDDAILTYVARTKNGPPSSGSK